MTQRDAQDVLRKIPPMPADMPKRHSTLWKKSHYGWTEKQVRSRLVKANVFGTEVWIHRDAMNRTDRWIKAVRYYEKRTKKATWRPKVVQCFNWRHMRNDPNAPLSNHSWAIAFDIDPATNGATYNTATAHTSIPAYVFALAEKNDIRIGLRFGDPMHFDVLY